MDPIERHIKQHFDNKGYTYNEAHWLEAQKLIAENKRRRRGWFYWWTGAVSAILFATLAFSLNSAETKIVANSDSENIEIVGLAELLSSESELDQSADKAAIINSVNDNSTNSTNSHSFDLGFQNSAIASDSKTPSNKSDNAGKYRKNERKSEKPVSGEILNQDNIVQQKSAEIKANNPRENLRSGVAETEVKESEVRELKSNMSGSNDGQQMILNESNSESLESVSPDEIVVSEENSVEQADIVPITPVANNSRFGWGFVAGYLMQKQFTHDQWLNGAYFGGRASWLLSPKWSIGVDVSAVFQEMKAVHFHHDVTMGYGFGRDSLVTDMYAKRAITLQIPLAVSYASGRHTFSGMIGTRILLDAQAKMQKLHYTNMEPENTVIGAVVSRSTMVAEKEQLMPEGTLVPFSVYSGLRYGWMIGKGWGLETNITVPLYHKNAKLDLGTKMAVDQGVRFEIGVMNVF